MDTDKRCRWCYLCVGSIVEDREHAPWIEEAEIAWNYLKNYRRNDADSITWNRKY